MKLSKGKIQKLHNTKNQSQRKNKKKGKKRPANHNTLRKRHTNLATKTLKRKNKSTLYGGNDDTGKVGQKFEELIDAMSEVFASDIANKVVSKIGSTGKTGNQDSFEAVNKGAKKVSPAGKSLTDKVANDINPSTTITDTQQQQTQTAEEPTESTTESTTESNSQDAIEETTSTTDTTTVPPPPKKSRFSSFLNVTQKVRDSFNKNTQSIDEKKANKIFDDNDTDKSGNLDETEYKGIQEQFKKDGGFLTLPDYDEKAYKEVYPNGIDKKQFVKLYKTAITEAKEKAKANSNEKGKEAIEAPAIKAEAPEIKAEILPPIEAEANDILQKAGLDPDKDKLNPAEYKKIKHHLKDNKGLKLQDYKKIPDGEKNKDGITKEKFVELYKNAKIAKPNANTTVTNPLHNKNRSINGGAKKNRTRKLKGNKQGNKRGKGKKNNK